MTAQVPLPLLAVGAVPIGDAAGLVVGEAGGAVFVWGALWWSWQDGDEAGRRIAAVQLATGKIATRIEIAAAFDTTPATLWRWCRDYDRDGIAGLVSAKPGPKGAWKLTDEVIGQIVALDAQGLTQAKVAERAGVSSFSVRQVLAERVRPAAPGADEVNGLPVVPVPTPRTGERQAARYGQLGEAVPVFTQGRQLPLAGLLLCLPALEATGLLEVAGQVYGKLKNGFYGLKPMLLTLVFLALLREPRAEGATRIVPGDLGRILAFDRAPEVSTIRRKLGELSARGKAGQLMAGLARHHLATHPDAVGFLYIDGHVRAYHGTRRLPKTHVARMRIAMPATLETWVCDSLGDPVYAVVAPPSASTAAEVRRLLPDIATMVDGRRTTIVFDRGGWSPGLFAHLLDEGFELLTYRKGDYRAEPASAFTQHRWIDERGIEHLWELSDRNVRIHLSATHAKRYGRKTLLLRQIVRHSPGGHQTAILTSRFDLPTAHIAARMFNRWRQENYFRYGRAHFALDSLDSYAIIDDDPDRSVPNPAKRAARKQTRRLETAVVDGEAAIGRRHGSAGLDTSLDQLQATLDEVRGQLATARQAAKAIPTRVPLAQIAPDARLLDTEPKLITHAVRMAAYNTESVLARQLKPHYARANHEARSLIREALAGTGDLHIDNGQLHVTLNPLSAPRRTTALANLCDLLNDTHTIYPGTDLALHYTVKPHPSTT